jgi:hypothetical protein
MGWPYRFKEQSWADVSLFEREVWGNDSRGRYLLDIIDSVLVSGVCDQLAVTTSMHDLLIVGRPVPDPPMDVLLVRAPDSVRATTIGHVLIEYKANSGRDTVIERPVEEAVRLFWRFVDEKFGVRASGSDRPPT